MAHARRSPGVMRELAYWDERREAVRVPIVFENWRTVSCALTRGAAQALSLRPILGVRECFGVLRRCADEIVSIAHTKVRAGEFGADLIVSINTNDVAAHRTLSRFR
jgi:hypothetical protein